MAKGRQAFPFRVVKFVFRIFQSLFNMSSCLSCSYRGLVVRYPPCRHGRFIWWWELMIVVCFCFVFFWMRYKEDIFLESGSYTDIVPRNKTTMLWFLSKKCLNHKGVQSKSRYLELEVPQKISRERLHFFRRTGYNLTTVGIVFSKGALRVCCKRICIEALVFSVFSLGGGFKYFLFSPLFGEDSQFD